MNRSTGITDEAAIAEHDLMANAEREEQRLHPTGSMTEDPNEQTRTGLGASAPGGQAGTGNRKGSIVDKVKDALHMKK